MTTYQITPVIPLWLLALLLLFGAVGIWSTLARCAIPLPRKLVLFGLRFAAVLLLALLLLLPKQLRVSQHREPPVFAVVTDVSASMTDSPLTPKDQRMAAARKILADRHLRGLADQYHLVWYEVGAELEEGHDPANQPLVFNAPRTHLLHGLNQLQQRQRGANLAGVLLLTDGLDQSEEPLTPEAQRIPVYLPELEPPPTAATAPARQELFLAEVNHPKLLVVRWKGQVDVTVKRSTPVGKSACSVKLFANNELQRTSSLVFDDGETVKQVSFVIEPQEIGQLPYRVELDTGTPLAAGDKEGAKNRTRLFMVDVVDPQNRILVLEGAPRWEFKYLKRALLKDKNFKLSAFMGSGSGVFLNFSEESGGASRATELPELTEEQAVQYRAIVLGELTAKALTPKQQAAIAAFVDKGGGLLFLGGSQAYGPEGWPASPIMSKLLPFANRATTKMADGRFSITIAGMGKGHPLLSGLDSEGAFPPVLSLWMPVDASPSAQVLLTAGDGAPLLLTNRYGKGKVAAVLTDSMWRWQLGAAQTGDSKSLYEQLMSQMVYWLSPQEKQVQETSNLQLVLASGEAELRQRVSLGAVMGERTGAPEGQVLHAVIKTPDGRELKQDMTAAKLGDEVGLTKPVWGWRTEFVPYLAGEYQITVTPTSGKEVAKARVVVSEPQLELTGQPLNRAFLEKVAQQTGGKAFPPEQLAEVLSKVPYHPVEQQLTDEQDLWNKAWILGLLLTLFVAEWWYRSRLDLV